MAWRHVDDQALDIAFGHGLEVITDGIEFNIMLPFFNILYKIDKLLFSDLSLPLYSSIESIDFFSSCDEHDERDEHD